MHLEVVIENVGRYTWRPWSNKIGEVLRGGWCGSNWSEGGQSGGIQSGGSESWVGRSGGMRDGSWDSIHWSTCDCGNVENWVKHGPLRAERLAGRGGQSIVGWWSTGWMQYSAYAVFGVCCTRCMLYSVYAVLGVWCTSVYAVLGVCCTQCMLYSVLTLDHGIER